MNVKQALSILRPQVNNEQGLKDAYRRACMTHHPDRGGDPEIMKLVNLAYETLKGIDYWWTPTQAREAARETPLTETLKAKWEAIKRYPGLKIEIVGSWLWVSGNTRSIKEVLKENGFRFSKNKIAWYYHEEPYRKRHKKKYSMDDLRDLWGSENLKTEPATELS